MFKQIKEIQENAFQEIEEIQENAFEEIQEVINNYFFYEIAPYIVKKYEQDQCALDEEYNNWTDSLCKEGIISDDIYNNLCLDSYTDSQWRELLSLALQLKE